MPLSNVQIEISGQCNARCPYCITGQKNRKQIETGDFMTIEDFVKVISVLQEKAIINNDTIISLYNYGEPLLHPYFSEIIDELETRGFLYDISTNGSILLDKNVLSKMKHLVLMQFSICGMSQGSYNRIHGFKVEKVMDNIQKTIHILRENENNTECLMKLQMYQFNKDEYFDALQFSKENEMTVIPLHAICANLQQQAEMITEYKKTGKSIYNNDLILDYLPELLKIRNNASCVEHSGLVVDENLNIALCCMATKEMESYYWSSLDKITLTEIEKRKKNRCCLECMSEGINLSICNTPSYKKPLLKRIREILEKKKEMNLCVIGNDAITKSFLSFFYDYPLKVEKNLDISKLDNSTYYILASKEWWKEKRKLAQYKKKETEDYYIYNTYLR